MPSLSPVLGDVTALLRANRHRVFLEPWLEKKLTPVQSHAYDSMNIQVKP